MAKIRRRNRISADPTEYQETPFPLPGSPGEAFCREPGCQRGGCFFLHPHATAASDTVRVSRGIRHPQTATGRRPPGVLQPAAGGFRGIAPRTGGRLHSIQDGRGYQALRRQPRIYRTFGAATPRIRRRLVNRTVGPLQGCRGVVSLGVMP